MSETNSTTITPVDTHDEPTTRLAYAAVTAHMVDHDLPAFASMALSIDHRSIRVQVIWDADVTTWLDTLHVDSEAVEIVNGNVHTTYSCRLPDSGVRVSVTSVRLGLHSVSA